MKTYKVKYSFSKPGSNSRNTGYLTVKAETQRVALELAKTQVEYKHPGYQVSVLEAT